MIWKIVFTPLLLAGICFSQQDVVEPESKRILGLVPNYRSSASLKPYKPLTAEEKFKIASKDSFDRGTVVLAALFGGQAQLTNSNPAFGQGVKGYARYWSSSYADYVIGNFMTEGIYPTVLHQDPRYFRSGEGSGWSRAGYAMKQILRTHKDADGSTQWNYSELV